MLASKNRLRKKKDIERVLREGKSLKQDFVILKVKQNTINTARFVFIVSQKVSKRAVVRNKVKRRLREIIKEKIDIIEKGIDVSLIALSGIEKNSFQEIKESIEKLFKKAKIISL